MEAKSFFEVFTRFSDNVKVTKAFDGVMVKRIVNNHAKNLIKIYIECNRLIHKEDIYMVENELVKMFNGSTGVKIIEKFNLSKQYNSENLFDMYKESILQELYNHSPLEYSMLKKSKIEFNDDIMLITLSDNLISKDKSSELKRILEKIFNERCGVPTEIRYDFVEISESKYDKISKLKIEQEIDNIIANVNKNSENSKANIENENIKNSQNKEKKSSEISSVKEASVQAANKKYDKGTFNRNPSKGKSGFRNSDNPDVYYGREILDMEIVALKDIEGEMGQVTVRGQIVDIEKRPIRGERTIVSIIITDFTDSIVVKLFMQDDRLEELFSNVKNGAFVKVKGVTTVDPFDNDLIINSVYGIMKTSDFTVKRMDTSPEKRVELHCHTKLSDMDGVADAKDLIKRAKEWGHSALAITDHGVVQGFTEAWHALQKLEGKFSFKEPFDFKMIYGVEAYLVDDLKEVVTNSKNQSLDEDFVVFDIETTGFSPDFNKIIEIGAVKVRNGNIYDKFSTFVNPQEPIPFRIEQLTGINDNMVIDAPLVEEVLPEFLKFSEGCVMVAHNADFDMSFIIKNAKSQGIEREFTILDTVALARMLLPQISKYKLDAVAKALGVSLENHHRAVDDAGCTAEIFVKFIEMLKERDVFTLDEINGLGNNSIERIKKLPTHHAIILAKNEEGRKNLYRLVSNSNILYYNRQPRIPKSDYLKHKEGLIIGSACEAGELYQAIVLGRSEEEIARLADFYDYFEIQPIGNNEFMIESDKYSVSSVEELQEMNRKIVKLGEQFNKPVVATCDVHFLDPQDEVYRRIIMACKGFKDADKQAPLYLRTTDEMLEEFKYLGSDKAYEIVVTNTNMISDMVDNIFPVCPDKCAPVIENSDQILREICYNTAHSMYGENLPEIVVERLELSLIHI